MESFGESLARPLGASDAGPIEPPEPMPLRVPYGVRARWVGLGTFALIGTTAILLFSGIGDATTTDLRSVWKAELPVARPVHDVVWDTVFAVSVDDLPSIGPPDAKVTLVVVTDYAPQCVGCERWRPLLWSLRSSYGADLRIMFKPHAEPRAVPSAAAACAANRHGAFERYDMALFLFGDKSRERGMPIALPDATNPGCVDDVAGCREATRLARDLGLDLERFAANVKSCAAIVRASTSELAKLGVDAPAFFVNGRRIDPWGTESIGTFQTLIDDELATARRRIAAGTTQDRYYQQWVLDAGRTTR